MMNLDERLRDIGATVKPIEPVYAVVYTTTIQYDDDHGDMTTEKVDTFKKFGSIEEFNEWVLNTKHHYEAFEVIPLTVKTHVTVSATRK